MTAVPAGLAVRKRLFPGSDVAVWDIIHERSDKKVIVACRTRTDAVDAAARLGELADWTAHADVLVAACRLSARVLRVQQAVWSPARKRVRA